MNTTAVIIISTLIVLLLIGVGVYIYTTTKTEPARTEPARTENQLIAENNSNIVAVYKIIHSNRPPNDSTLSFRINSGVDLKDGDKFLLTDVKPDIFNNVIFTVERLNKTAEYTTFRAEKVPNFDNADNALVVDIKNIKIYKISPETRLYNNYSSMKNQNYIEGVM